jgi:uncharacterized protein (UPF0210 family)
MLTDREIISTLEMLKNENLDVRTVTLGINLLDCASHDVNKLKNKIRTRIAHYAENLVSVCDGMQWWERQCLRRTWWM